MCGTCGCSTESTVTITDVNAGSVVSDDSARLIQIEQDILAKNGRLAERNRQWLAARGVTALNIMSSPGAGKTTLVEKTILSLRDQIGLAVIEGDQATLRDAERIRGAGGRAIQINTGEMCHLNAEVVGNAMRQLDPASGSLIIIENVGNLVCPSMFDLGEAAKIVVASVTEGDDKPQKYPYMFHAADVIVLNKMDLLPYVDFDVAAFRESAVRLNPEAQLILTSATQGEGINDWFATILGYAKKAPCASA